MKKIAIIFFNTVILFVLLNILIALIWPKISDFRNKNYSYIDEVSELLELNSNDLMTLHNETWRKNYKFRYEPFIGHTEIDKSGKFVNFSYKDGRKVNRPENCDLNLYLYGGSTAFGYGVTDAQTIAEYLQQSLLNNYCIFNHGRASFYSLQENYLFFEHIQSDRKIDLAIFLDGMNETCGGHFAVESLSNNFSSFAEKPYLLWQKTSLKFLYSLPIYQLTLKFGSTDWLQNLQTKSYMSIESCKNNISINELFEKRINLRDSMCEKFDIKCINLLQPMPGSSGNHSNKLIKENQLNYQIKKYNALKKVKKNIIDMQYVLNASKKLSYIDATHYSPESNYLIAEEIKRIILN